MDFTVEVERSLRVLDGSVTVMCAKGGVEPQSETVWRQADHYKVPRMIYVNKMDIMGADFYNVLNMIHDRLKCNAVPIQLPIGSEDTFKGIIDLVEMDADIYYDELGKDMRVEEIPADMLELAQEYRTKLIDACADIDDEIMELALEEKPIPEDMIRRALRKGTIENLLVPVTCGTSYRNKGVQKLLDAIVDFMPSPLDIPAIKGVNPDTDEEDERPADDNAPFSALAFKIMTDPSCGPPVLLPCVLRQAHHRFLRAQQHQEPEGAHRPHPADACQPPGGHRGGLLRRHRCRRGPEEHHHRRYPVR